jgi:hypothetical protein
MKTSARPLAKEAIEKSMVHSNCGGSKMSLTSELNCVMMSRCCSRCGWECRHQGTWFRAIRHYTCAECGAVEVVTYDEKLKLFAKAKTMRPLIE